MSEQPEDKIVKAVIESCETGEETSFEHYPFSTHSTMETIVKIKHVDSFDLSDGCFQLSIDCLALDSGGDAFDLDLNFHPETTDLRDQILKELVEGSLWMAKGEYSVLYNEERIFLSLYEPEYKSLPADLELDVESAFRINRQESNSAEIYN